MTSFFDTSAIVPLILRERHSDVACEVWNATSQAWAWRWMRVEAEAALGRRRAGSEAWRAWRSIASVVHWLDLGSADCLEICAFNRPLRLRAADAGHLFVFDRAAGVIPELKLVSFDGEMTAAARSLNLPVWHLGS
jgi:predicted nucleic acid-binding protein